MVSGAITAAINLVVLCLSRDSVYSNFDDATAIEDFGGAEKSEAEFEVRSNEFEAFDVE